VPDSKDGGRGSVRLRLYSVAAITAFFTAVVGGVGLFGYASLNAANTTENQLGTVQALALQEESLQHAIQAKAWLAVGDAASGVVRPASEAREFDETKAELGSSNGKLAGAEVDSAYAPRLQQLAADENELLALAEGAIAASAADRPTALERIHRLEDKGDQLDGQVTTLTGDIAADRAQRMAAANDLTRTDSLRLLAAAVLATLLVFAFCARLCRSILHPLRAVAEVAGRIGAGDLDARCDLSGMNEIDTVALAVNSTADKLRTSMHTLAAEAKRERLGSQLTEAFDMAETEAEAYLVVSRTLHLLDPQRSAELLLADNSRARLDRLAVSGPGEPPCCPVTAPFSCVAVRRGHTTVFDDSDALNACPKLKGRPAGRMSAVCVPVTFMGRSLGVLHTTGVAGQRPEEDTLAALSQLAGQTGSRIGTLRSFAQAQLQASTDGLTGLRNRRAFESGARELLRGGGRAALVMADLDNFKILNDTHGHEAGDRALRVFGQALRVQLRENDVAGRIGGEEFGLVLPDLSVEEAVTVVERLRDALREQGNAATPAFTASFGISWTDGHSTFDELLRAADRALYRSKRNGRDRITLADQPDDAQVAVSMN